MLERSSSDTCNSSALVRITSRAVENVERRNDARAELNINFQRASSYLNCEIRSGFGFNIKTQRATILKNMSLLFKELICGKVSN